MSSDVVIDQPGERIRIRFPFDRESVERVKLIPGREWNKAKREWLCPRAVLPFVMAHFPEAVYAGKLAEEAQKHFQFWTKGKDTARTFNGEYDPPGRKLLAFQPEGIDRLRILDRGLLGDQMGLAKSASALVLANLRKPSRVLILCRASHRWNWAKECYLAFPGEPIGIGFGSSGKWIIESYDTIWRPKAMKTLERRSFDVAILDEVHAVKNPKTKRAEGALELLKRIPVRYGLTGTPMQNRAEDLIGVLQALGYLTPSAAYGFKMRYCRGEDVQYWKKDEDGIPRLETKASFSGSSNLEELHRVMQFFTVRRLKADVLKDLPPKIYTDDVFELGSDSSYWKAEEHYREYIRRVKAGKADASKVSRTQNLFSLGQAAAVAKIDVVQERVEDIVSSGLKVLVFSSYREPVKRLAGLLGPKAVHFTGETPPEERSRIVQKFQENEFIRVACVTTKAGGESFTMTAAKVVGFMDQPWNPAIKAQAEDRAHRIGQDRGLQVINWIAKDSIDERMLAIQAKKHGDISLAVDGVEEESGFGQQGELVAR